MSIFSKNPDEPIATAKQDRFGRENFAHSVGEALVKVPKSQSLTTGLYGTWGSGKTSVINLTIEYLEKQYKDKVIVIRFNPWVFSSTESLHLAFFSTLASNLEGKIDKGKQNISDVLQKYGELTGPISDTVGLFFPPAAWPSKVAKIAASWIGKAGPSSSKKIDIEAKRNRVNEMLVKSGKRIVVVIDDIDRLDSDEIHQIFKLVKNIAHFCNISYLLAFDQIVVAEALAKQYPSNPLVGGSFIDKIIQLPLYMPSVDQSLLNKYLTEELDKIIEQNKLNIAEEDMSRFQSTFFVRDIEDLFDTPRKVIRYLNTFDFSVERLRNEINFADTALIDLLRNFYPRLYTKVANNKQLLLRQSLHGERGNEEQNHVRQLLFGDQQPTGLEVTIIKELFPTIEWVFGGPGYADGFLEEWERSKRVCSEKYFNRYFAYDIPIGDIADAEIENLLIALGNTKTTQTQAEKLLNNICKKSDPAIVISKLRRKEEELEAPVSEKLARTLVRVGVNLPRPKQALAGDMFSPYIQSAVLAVKLTRNVADPYKLLENFIKLTPVNYSAEILRWIRVNSEKSKDSGEDFVALLSTEQVDQLGKLLANRIKQYASNHYIHNDFPQDVAHIMWIWQKWGNKADIAKYFENSFKNSAERAIDFLMTYVSDAWEIGTGKKTRSDFRREAYDAISQSVDPEVFVNPLIKLYGKEVNEGSYDSVRFDKDIDYKNQIARQFLYIHRNKDKEQNSNKSDVLEGEVVSED